MDVNKVLLKFDRKFNTNTKFKKSKIKIYSKMN